MKVKYLEETGHYLTRNKIYEILDESGNSYKLKEDTGDNDWWLKSQFEVVTEEPDAKAIMKVKYLEETGPRLTEDKIYEVVDESGGSYEIKDDKNGVHWWPKYWFEVISEEPEEKAIMKVRFIKETGRCLTRNKIYEVLGESDKYYEVKDDQKGIGWWYKSYFEVVEESPFPIDSTKSEEPEVDMSPETLPRFSQLEIETGETLPRFKNLELEEII